MILGRVSIACAPRALVRLTFSFGCRQDDCERARHSCGRSRPPRKISASPTRSPALPRMDYRPAASRRRRSHNDQMAKHLTLLRSLMTLHSHRPVYVVRTNRCPPPPKDGKERRAAESSLGLASEELSFPDAVPHHIRNSHSRMRRCAKVPLKGAGKPANDGI